MVLTHILLVGVIIAITWATFGLLNKLKEINNNLIRFNSDDSDGAFGHKNYDGRLFPKKLDNIIQELETVNERLLNVYKRQRDNEL